MIRVVIPALKERGVSDTDIETIFIDNPKRIFDR